MNSVKFGDVGINDVSQKGRFTHLRLTVTGDERDPFRPVVKEFNAVDRINAQTRDEAWKFTVGITPTPNEPLRVLPGHILADEVDFSHANPKAAPISAPAARPVVEAIAPQLEAASKTVNSWLGKEP